MRLELVIAGSGGQGALTAGQLIAVAGVRHGKHVTNTPIYTPEVRGGSSNALVVVSEEQIGSMMVAEPNAGILLSDLSTERLLPTFADGAAVVVNTTLVRADALAPRPDLRSACIPATDLAAELGDARVGNMVAVGALATMADDLPLEWLLEALPELLGERRMRFLELNRSALEVGARAVR